MKKYKLFSHTDLDGYGCNILFESMLSNHVEYDCENLNYDSINERIKEFIANSEYKEYDKIFITDISVNEEVSQRITELYHNEKVNFQLIDHHPTASWLNIYDWCEVTCGTKESGASLLLDYIINNENDVTFAFKDIYKICYVAQLVEMIRLYDTWEWKEQNNDIPKKLNDLFYLLGAKKFMKTLEENNYNVDETLKANKDIMEVEQNKIERYIDSKNKTIIPATIKNYKIGVVFAEQYISELGNRLSEMNPIYDLIAIISDNSISYRTVKEDIDCGAFAKLFGGGGHPKAAGSQITDENKQLYINKLFNINKRWII